MANFLRLSNGAPRSFSESSSVAIYDQTIDIVLSSPTGNDLVGPILTGVAVTLPASGSYTVINGVTGLNIFFNGQKLDYGLDWTTSGGGPDYTAVAFTFDVIVGDRIEFRQERNT